MPVIEENGELKKEKKIWEMETEICLHKHTYKPCWLSLEYNNQLEQKGLKKTLIFETSVWQSRDLVWEAVCGHTIQTLYKQIKLLSVFFVCMCGNGEKKDGNTNSS